MPAKNIFEKKNINLNLDDCDRQKELSPTPTILRIGYCFRIVFRMNNEYNVH